MASCLEIREAYVQAVIRGNDAECAFWKVQLLERLGALSVALGHSDGVKPTDSGAE